MYTFLSFFKNFVQKEQILSTSILVDIGDDVKMRRPSDVVKLRLQDEISMTWHISRVHK